MDTRLLSLTPEAARRLASFKRQVEEALPGQVVRITLFGSRARGDADEDSDYDVAVFVRGSAERMDIRDSISDIAYRHILEGIHISAVVLPFHYVENADQAELASEIARDGVIL
jgi:predicted nucleotidyltransferase